MIQTLTIKLNLTESESKLQEIVEKRQKTKVKYFRIVKKSLDARDKNHIFYLYSVEYSNKDERQTSEPVKKLSPNKLPEKPVVIVGSGPAGLFCAVRLIDHGICPVVLERGDTVDERERKTKLFSLSGVLDTESNIQFGEGGAGTFSDGKLNTGTHTKENREVLETFVRFGAPEEILYLSKPHIGSDKLKTVVKNMRSFILEHGGKMCFRTKLTDLILDGDMLKGVEIATENGRERLDVSALILAVGHSARDTFEMLKARGVKLSKKDFAVGVRIEHLQEKIGFSQYGKNYTLLPPADYKLVYKGERSAFTFCMCPGGYVMPASSEEGRVVVNGMSNYLRDGKNANSALVVQVRSSDFGEDVLSGMEFQREIEKKAFLVGGSDYSAPVQRVEDFLSDRESHSFGEVLPTYQRTAFGKMQDVLPKTLIDTLKNAVVDMDKRLKGFAHPDAVLTAVESRTSSPVRIDRTETCQSVSTKNLYPCGEGAGYAGGITSSAADGIRLAELLFMKFEA